VIYLSYVVQETTQTDFITMNLGSDATARRPIGLYCRSAASVVPCNGAVHAFIARWRRCVYVAPGFELPENGWGDTFQPPVSVRITNFIFSTQGQIWDFTRAGVQSMRKHRRSSTAPLPKIFGRPYYRSSLWYSVSSVVCLSVTFCIVAKRCVLAKNCLKE